MSPGPYIVEAMNAARSGGADRSGSMHGAPPPLSITVIRKPSGERSAAMSTMVRHKAYGPIHRPGTSPYFVPAEHIEWIEKHAPGLS